MGQFVKRASKQLGYVRRNHKKFKEMEKTDKITKMSGTKFTEFSENLKHLDSEVKRDGNDDMDLK